VSAAGAPLLVALGEYDIGWHDPDGSLQRADELIQRAAGAGARLVLLPEMTATGFTMDPAQASAPDGPHVQAISRAAARARAWVLAGLALRDGDSSGSARPVNAAVLFDPSGAVVATYRKQRLFAYGGEHQHYAPGDTPLTVTVEGVRVSPFICYDLRFPELFRAVARDTDLLAIVANWPAARRAHWDLLLRARAVENLTFVAAVNRTGEGGKLVYDGGSAAYDPWGERLPEARPEVDVSIVAIDPARVRATRERYPFLDDM
jgi:predicted amidohydrolase